MQAEINVQIGDFVVIEGLNYLHSIIRRLGVMSLVL